MLSGRSRAMNLSTNALIELAEARSSFSKSIRADWFWARISFFAFLHDSIFLAAIITWTFLRAKTLAVSKPIPLAPPGSYIDTHIISIQTVKENL